MGTTSALGGSGSRSGRVGAASAGRRTTPVGRSGRRGGASFAIRTAVEGQVAAQVRRDGVEALDEAGEDGVGGVAVGAW